MTKTNLRLFLAALGFSAALCAQTPATQTPAQTPAQAPARRPARGATISGTVKDDTGGIIPGATVTLATQSGTVQSVQTGSDGTYTFRNVPPGTYTISATYSGLQQEGASLVNVTGTSPTTSNLTMTVQAQRQEVTVTDTSTNTVSTEPANNATALVLKQEDLDALPETRTISKLTFRLLLVRPPARVEIRFLSTASAAGGFLPRSLFARSASIQIHSRLSSTSLATAASRSSRSLVPINSTARGTTT
jgi:hypothetical protein